MTHEEFFTRVDRVLAPLGYRCTGGTQSGKNVYSPKGFSGKINVTVNHKGDDDHGTLKLTIHRGISGAATPVFDATRARYSASPPAASDVVWIRDSGRNRVESKAEFTPRPQLYGDAWFKWLATTVQALRGWADYAASV